MKTAKLARWLFAASGICGIAVLLPLYFVEAYIAKASGAFTQPEYFYGFIGTALTAQIMFFIISHDPLRFRPAMLFAVLEKLAFAIPVSMLFASGRVFGSVVVFGSIDFAWAALFAAAWVITGRAERDVSL
ncbi:hypothetical protein JQ624_33950 [Bradyrhizobium sp. AUGA SZCCT0283]|nr:hypothetical protein [Bradyrhizobium sp. AUGA SZCCT0283]